jgi:hypothetical protein
MIAKIQTKTCSIVVFFDYFATKLKGYVRNNELYQQRF